MWLSRLGIYSSIYSENTGPRAGDSVWDEADTAAVPLGFSLVGEPVPSPNVPSDMQGGVVPGRWEGKAGRDSQQYQTLLRCLSWSLAGLVGKDSKDLDDSK